MSWTFKPHNYYELLLPYDLSLEIVWEHKRVGGKLMKMSILHYLGGHARSIVEDIPKDLLLDLENAKKFALSWALSIMRLLTAAVHEAFPKGDHKP